MMFSPQHSTGQPMDHHLLSVSPRRRRRKRLVVAWASLFAIGTVVSLLWALTEPLVPNASAWPAAGEIHVAPVPIVTPPPPAEWPKTTLAGDPAKVLLLELLQAADRRLKSVDYYTATFRKQERMRGKLPPEQTLQMKVRNQPFALYLKFLAPKKGKEVLYGVGLHDGKVIAHNGDWTRRLIPRLAVAPTDPLALADTRHPVTDAGLVNLTQRLIGYRKLDLTDPQAVTILDRVKDDQGREWPRSIHTHPVQNDERPFSRVDVLYDPVTFIPHKISCYEWPEAGSNGEQKLGESYEYDDLDLDAPLNDRDFDLTNPDYEFTRF